MACFDMPPYMLISDDEANLDRPGYSQVNVSFIRCEVRPRCLPGRENEYDKTDLPPSQDINCRRTRGRCQEP